MSGLMVMMGFIGQLSQCKPQMTHFSLGGSVLDFNVITQPSQAIHEFAL